MLGLSKDKPKKKYSILPGINTCSNRIFKNFRKNTKTSDDKNKNA